MRTYHFMIIFVVGLVSVMTTPDASGRSAPPDLDAGSNAALQYWQAFALLPPTSPDRDKVLENWRDTPLDPTADKLIEDFDSSRKYLLRASRLRSCDWGLVYEDGQFLQLPYLAKARSLANLTALHARSEFVRGRWASGVEDVLALLHLARHLEAEPIMVVQMLGFKVEAMAIDSASPFLKAGGATLIDPLARGLEALSDRPKASEVIRKEKEVCVAGLVHRLKVAEGREKGAWRGVWKPLEHDTWTPVTTFEQAVTTSESLAPYYDRLAAEAALPWPEFDPNDGAYGRRLEATNKLAYTYLATLVSYVGADRRALTRLELFRAALSVARRGPDSLEAFKDPAGDGREPFRYRELGEGIFSLSSQLSDAPSSRLGPRPIALTVGSKPATGLPTQKHEPK